MIDLGFLLCSFHVISIFITFITDLCLDVFYLFRLQQLISQNHLASISVFIYSRPVADDLIRYRQLQLRSHLNDILPQLLSVNCILPTLSLQFSSFYEKCIQFCFITLIYSLTCTSSCAFFDHEDPFGVVDSLLFRSKGQRLVASQRDCSGIDHRRRAVTSSRR